MELLACLYHRAHLPLARSPLPHTSGAAREPIDMGFSLSRIFGGGSSHNPAPIARPRLDFPEWPAVVYAIGDIHGCSTLLRQLQDLIVQDSEGIDGDKLIVCLGDYVDRGENTATVLDLLTARPPAGFRRICLAGNHEIMMLEHLADPRPTDQWMNFGGVETLLSYGISPSRYLTAGSRERAALLKAHIPEQHIEFLQGLPTTLSFPNAVFVHAGLRPETPLAEQVEDDLLWIRTQPDPATLPHDAPMVIHGHTPSPEPVLAEHHICVDTGAYATGILTAVRLRINEPPRFLKAGRPTGAQVHLAE